MKERKEKGKKEKSKEMKGREVNLGESRITDKDKAKKCKTFFTAPKKECFCSTFQQPFLIVLTKEKTILPYSKYKAYIAFSSCELCKKLTVLQTTHSYFHHFTQKSSHTLPENESYAKGIIKSQFWRIFGEELKGEGELTSQHPKTVLKTLNGKPQLPKPRST